MKKALKITGKVLLWTLAVIIILVLALPLWIGPVAKGVANAVVPGITGTAFHLGEFGLNPYTGKLHVGDLQLANPTNYSEKNAVDLKALDVDLAVTSLFGDKICVESIDLNGLFVYSAADVGNFKQIAENASGGKKAAEEAKAAEAEAKAEETKAAEAKAEQVKAEAEQIKAGAEQVAEAKTEETPAVEPVAGQKQQKGVVIDRVTLKDITVKYGLLPIHIPMDIVVTDIGKDKPEGASFLDAWQAVFNKVFESMTSAGGAAMDAGKAAVGAATDAAGAAVNAASDAAGAAVDAASDAVNAVKNLFK